MTGYSTCAVGAMRWRLQRLAIACMVLWGGVGIGAQMPAGAEDKPQQVAEQNYPPIKLSDEAKAQLTLWFGYRKIIPHEFFKLSHEERKKDIAKKIDFLIENEYNDVIIKSIVQKLHWKTLRNSEDIKDVLCDRILESGWRIIKRWMASRSLEGVLLDSGAEYEEELGTVIPNALYNWIRRQWESDKDKSSTLNEIIDQYGLGLGEKFRVFYRKMLLMPNDVNDGSIEVHQFNPYIFQTQELILKVIGIPVSREENYFAGNHQIDEFRAFYANTKYLIVTCVPTKKTEQKVDEYEIQTNECKLDRVLYTPLRPYSYYDGASRISGFSEAISITDADGTKSAWIIEVYIYRDGKAKLHLTKVALNGENTVCDFKLPDNEKFPSFEEAFQ